MLNDDHVGVVVVSIENTCTYAWNCATCGTVVSEFSQKRNELQPLHGCVQGDHRLVRGPPRWLEARGWQGRVPSPVVAATGLSERPALPRGTQNRKSELDILQLFGHKLFARKFPGIK